MACSVDNIAAPSLSGLNFQPLQAELVSGYSTSLPGLGYWIGHDTLNITDLSFCNVSLTYTHDGHTEPIHTHVYLPYEEDWNRRMKGIGGGGWSAGLYELSIQHMAGAVSEGYVAVSTDGGGNPWFPDPANWMLNADGTVNMYLLETFAHTALGDAAKIGKAIAESLYGAEPEYSYYEGCSQGGRQGLMLAQKYPDAYDGVLSVAPALNIPSFLVANYWPSLLMNQVGEYPHKCEFEALRHAAIADCDYEDGIGDGIISNPSACLSIFNPFDLVDTTIPCSTATGERKISRTAARVAEAAWSGYKMHNGVPFWYPSSPDASLINQFGQARTLCEGDKCTASDPSRLATTFLRDMVRRGVNLTKIKPFGFDILFHSAKEQYDSVLATDSSDLTNFRNKGGKILSFHGLSDEIIPPAGSQKYYESVLEHDPEARDYFRYFDAPGLGHCFGGIGPYPTNSFADLVAWVEHGKVPETISAKGPANEKGQTAQRPLCTYPLVAQYRGTGDQKHPDNFYCTEEYLSTTPMKVMMKRAKKFFRIRKKPRIEL